MHHSISIRPFRALMLGAAVLFSFTGAAFAQKEEAIDLKKGKWSALTQYIGTYNYEAVFNDKAVKTELDKILKGQDINLKNEFQVNTPIGFEGECLLLSGNRERAADTNRVYLEICVGGIVNLAVYDTGKITVYSQTSNYQFFTEGMRRWIYFQINEVDLYAKPDNVQMVVKPD